MSVECPICRLRCDAFAPAGRRERANARCPSCGSLERDRIVWLYVRRETDLLAGPQPRQMLYVGREDCLARAFAREASIALTRLPAARLPDALTRLDDDDGRFDLVLCTYVLQDVDDERAALRELRRVLAGGGTAIVQVPIARGQTEEDRSIVDEHERARRFGSPRAVRRYGEDYPERLAQAGFDVTVDPYPLRLGSDATRYAVSRLDVVHVARPGAGSVERVAAARAAASRPAPAAAPRALVITWNMGNNSTSRAYYLADMLRRDYAVTLAGPLFGEDAYAIWEPLRGGPVALRPFGSGTLSVLGGDVARVAAELDADVVVACKPRLPSLLMAMEVRARCGVPVIIDVDERELSFCGVTEGIGLDALERRRGTEDFELPWGQAWTQACEGLVADADAVLVSSEVLEAIYGGTVVRHARDETLFDPARHDRDAVRAEFGYGPEDRVILFAGTTRPHKGVLEIAEALGELDDPRYRLCVIGSVPDAAQREALAASSPVRTQLIAFRPASEVPRLTLVGDLVCLPQDLSNATVWHQTPAKLSEALAMEVPVLARRTPPLAHFIDRGAVAEIGEAPLARRIDEMFAAPEAMRGLAERGRALFLAELSYAVGLEAFHGAGHGPGGRALAPAWQRAYDIAHGRLAVGDRRAGVAG